MLPWGRQSPNCALTSAVVRGLGSLVGCQMSLIGTPQLAGGFDFRVRGEPLAIGTREDTAECVVDELISVSAINRLKAE